MTPNIVLFRPVLIIVLAISFACPTIVVAQPVIPDNVRVVDENATGNNDGMTWEDAYVFLQDAFEFVRTFPDVSDEIWVAEGTYYPDECNACGPDGTDLRSSTFDLVDHVDLYGGFLSGDDIADRDPIVNETILSGDIDQDRLLDNDNSFHVVSAGANVLDQTLVDGFTITMGFADGFLPDDSGGGALLFNAAGFNDGPGFVDCVFERNLAVNGGGLFSFRVDLEIRRCTFDRNVATGTSSSDGGGGIHSDSDLAVVDCIFDSNDAQGGIGGAILAKASSALDLVNCEFFDNTAERNGGAVNGRPTPMMNCLLVRNTSNNNGGGLWVPTILGGSPPIVNCTFIANVADNDNNGIGKGGGIFVFGIFGGVEVANGILRGNLRGITPEQIEGFASVEYTNIEDDWTGGGTGNIDEVPDFGPGIDNYRLQGFSRGVDEGNNADVLCDEFDVDEDTFDCMSVPPQDTPDLDLRDRVVDGNEDMTATVDMGAYEFAQCPADFDGDCSVGATDLLALLVNWGPCGDCNDCPWDLDGNCTVGAVDLLILLVSWGPCACGLQIEPLTLAEELADACLSQENWDDFVYVMQNGTEEDKDRYKCWMVHYMDHCNRCTCTHLSECPSPDPFN